MPTNYCSEVRGASKIIACVLVVTGGTEALRDDFAASKDLESSFHSSFHSPYIPDITPNHVIPIKTLYNLIY